MEGIEYYLDAFRNYANFEGRSRRSEYWYFVLFNIVVTLLLASTAIFLPDYIAFFLYPVYVLAAIIPNLALVVRRLHDTNRSGWSLLFTLIPLAGAIIIFVFMIEEGTHGPNQYGPDPKMVPEEDSYI